MNRFSKLILILTSLSLIAGMTLCNDDQEQYVEVTAVTVCSPDLLY